MNFVLDGTGLEKRKYPLRTEIACGVSEEIKLTLGVGYAGAASLPAYSPVKDSTVDYSRRVELKDNVLICNGEFKLKTVEFNPAQYLALKSTLKSIDFDERKAPVLALTEAALAAVEDAPKVSTNPAVDSNARILESHKELSITDAHSAVLHGKYIKEILTYGGKKDEAEVKFHFNPSSEDAKIVAATVISKTGAKQSISTNEINVMDAGWNASAKRYTGGKILVANLPGVDIGSKIEVEYEIATKGKSYLSGFENFQTFDDLDKKEFDMTVPGDLRVQTALTGTPGIVQQETNAIGGVSHLRWNASHVHALPDESQLPPDWTFIAGVDYFIGDMDAYLTELKSTLIARSTKSAKAADVARGLAANAKSKVDGVKAIRDFVAKSVRQAGPSFTELPLAELSDADTTLKDGYGHGADRAILLYGMLSAGGWQPEFVLASGLPPVTGITNLLMSFPMPQNFQSVLVRVKVDGTDYYLNDTDQYARLGTTAMMALSP